MSVLLSKHSIPVVMLGIALHRPIAGKSSGTHSVIGNRILYNHERAYVIRPVATCSLERYVKGAA
jgi:hypothetical protein